MQRQHTRIARAFHWSVLALYVYGVAKQLDDVSQLADGDLLLTETVFAAVFLLVVIARYGYMRRVPTFHAARTPIDPQRARLARAFHRLLYLCFVLLPASGLWIGALYAAGSQDGWWMDAAVGLHEFCADASYFLRVFGRAPRETSCACEVSDAPSLSQALHLVNGATVHAKVARGGVVKALIDAGLDDAAAVDALYERALCRAPVDAERAAVLEVLAEAGDARKAALEDVFWALLTSNEFLFQR